MGVLEALEILKDVDVFSFKIPSSDVRVRNEAFRVFGLYYADLFNAIQCDVSHAPSDAISLCLDFFQVFLRNLEDLDLLSFSEFTRMSAALSEIRHYYCGGIQL